MATWTEIAIEMARRIAAENGCELESFSLDGVDTYEDDGVEMVMIKASCRIGPGDDEIPWEDEPEAEADAMPIPSTT
jgi:hypothetical protein